MKSWPARVVRYPWSILLLCILLILFFSSSQAQISNPVFLPVIFSPPPVLLPNGDFESVPIQWDLLPSGEQLIFSQTELPEGVIPFSGSHVAWLGDHEDPGISHNNEISQTFIVPVSTPILRFWRMIDSSKPECSLKDILVVCVHPTGELNCELRVPFHLCKSTSTYSWFQETVDLRKFAGQSITLRIQAITNNMPPLPYTSEVYLDDFTFSSH